MAAMGPQRDIAIGKLREAALILLNVPNSKFKSQPSHIRRGRRNVEQILGDSGFSIGNAYHEIPAELTVQFAKELSDRFNVGEPPGRFDVRVGQLKI